MEFFHEICLTVILSFIFAFLVAKLLSMASAGDAGEQDSVSRLGKKFDDGVVAEERVFKGEVKNLRLKPEERVEFVGEAVKVDEFQADLAQEKLERVQEGCEPVEFREDDQMATKEEGLEGVKAHKFLEDKLVEERSGKEDVKAGDADLGEVEKQVMSNDDRVEANLVEELTKDEQMPARDEEFPVIGCVNYQEKGIEGREKSRPNDEKAGMSGDDDDDWEGIERSDAEKLFAAAASFVGSTDNSDRLSNVGSDVQMQLYALHKIATEGSCHEPQPMTLKVSSRAKWNAWQRLGNMNPEVAMEQYISLLSDSVPGWMGGTPGVNSKKDSLEIGIPGAQAPDLTTVLHHQPSLETERKQEGNDSSVGGGDAIKDPHYLDRDKL
ncbi:acyl-CoA-binding domain-containing protein 3-like isoform X2 [Telopea speciosissima]|uniref:acyl-CoA-binding domain-containing protein 3-like isoform X2 n=1 Tax=Telopea speciosissima TaxID=54955 RepID=UPI001CC5C090|nr:acyl-CoA-binding domain-containing protein 3-like isoform X2 [Telopea speciosissima]